VVVLCVLTAFYVLASDSPSAQMLVAMLGLGVCALIASGFLTMGASIMIPVIRARAKQAQEARKAVTLTASAGERWRFALLSGIQPDQSCPQVIIQLEVNLMVCLSSDLVCR
jgi:hypothetical protein